VAVVGYMDVFIKLGALRRKHRVLVVDLPSIDAVLGMDFLARHDITVKCKQRLLSFPIAHGTDCVSAYQHAE
jgi:hypothetical protein